MSNTYTQLPVQFIFAVKKRDAMILDSWRERLHQFLTGIVQEKGHKLIQVNSMPDHVHLFAGMKPDESCSALMKRVKAISTLWINNSGFCKGKFNWQTGFGAFGYGRSQVGDVVRYIQNQQIHHRKESFLTEYKKFLKAFEIEYDEKFIFHEPI